MGVHTDFGAGGENNWEIEHLGHRGMCQDVVFHLQGRVIADDVVETDLVVDDQEGGIVLVNSFKFVARH